VLAAATTGAESIRLSSCRENADRSVGGGDAVLGRSEAVLAVAGTVGIESPRTSQELRQAAETGVAWGEAAAFGEFRRESRLGLVVQETSFGAAFSAASDGDVEPLLGSCRRPRRTWKKSRTIDYFVARYLPSVRYP